MLRSHLYVSQSRIDAPDVDAIVRQLVARADWFNRANDITGALICTGGRFAQVLEGRSGALEPLIERIKVDDRHTDMVTLRDVPIDERRFRDWSLAYIGPSMFIQRIISLPLAQTKRGSKPAVERLLTLIEEFAHQE